MFISNPPFYHWKSIKHFGSEGRQEIWCELHATARRYSAYVSKESTTSKLNSLRHTVSQMAGLLVYFKSAILTPEIYQALRLRELARNPVRIARSGPYI